MEKSRLAALAACALLLAACSDGLMHASGAWARPAPLGAASAVYLVLQNSTGQDDALLGASTDVARVTELHQSMLMGEGGMEGHHMDGEPAGEPANEIMMMMPVDRVEVSSGDKAILEPGGFHIMLIDLQRELIPGEHFTLILHFENASELEVEVLVAEQ